MLGKGSFFNFVIESSSLPRSSSFASVGVIVCDELLTEESCTDVEGSVVGTSDELSRVARSVGMFGAASGLEVEAAYVGIDTGGNRATRAEY